MCLSKTVYWFIVPIFLLGCLITVKPLINAGPPINAGLVPNRCRGGGGVECTEINKRRPLINAGGTGQWYSDLDVQVIASQSSQTLLINFTNYTN